MTTSVKRLISSTAMVTLAAVSGFGLAMPASAQQGQTQAPAQTGQPAAGQGAPMAAPAQAQPQAGQSAGGAASVQPGSVGSPSEDRLLATVNGEEIRQADLVTAIQGLPPQVVQQMPPQLLLPTVLDQLLMRELILARGYSEGLQEDPEVKKLLESSSNALEEQAIVRVWVERELAERVTDQQIQEAFQQFKAANPNAEVNLEQARPQIEQALNQQAIREITSELRQDAEITFYGPAGEPVAPQDAAQAGGQGQGQGQTGNQNQQTAPGQGNMPSQSGSRSGQGG